MSQEVKFCPNCDNILNITKNPPKKKQTGQIFPENDTPNTVSNSESDTDSNLPDNEMEQQEVVDNSTKVENIIVKLQKDEVVPDTYFGDLRLEQFIKNKAYIKLDKKTKPLVQAKLISYYEKIEDITSAYYFCGICSYSKPIDAGTLIASKMNSGVTGTYMNYDKLKNRKHNKMLGYTRNYKCDNSKCVSHTDHSKREAVIYRIGGNVQAWYTCRACESYWKGE
jgi:hypothetical protein